MKEGFERGKKKAHQFAVGDFVWLDGSDFKLKLSSEKLGDQNLGPFEILEKVGDLDYRLDLPEEFERHHPIFHVDKLYPFKGNVVNGLLPEPPAPIELEDEDEPEYEVEKILDSRYRWRRLEYRVKWKGYIDKHNTWEPAPNLKNAPRKVKEFHKNHPAAPGPAHREGA